jgi:hypothetical protein
MNNEITIEEIDEAYKKFKSYVYYDNNLFMRKQIAEFEADGMDLRLQDLCNHLNQIRVTYMFGGEFAESNDYTKNLLEKISYIKLPKTFLSQEKDPSLLSNIQDISMLEIKDFIHYVHAPIELHIISVLWIQKEGYHLVAGMNHCYGYVLDMNEDHSSIANGLRLFKPYFEEYKVWRDRAIDTAKNILTEKQNVGIISLDIKTFYHTVQLDFEEVRVHLKNKKIGTMFTDLLFKIYQTYSGLFPRNTDKSILPIGFLSSGILANWYLKKFDESINEILSPVYYGRYVDDILITLPIGNVKKYQSAKAVIHDLFITTGILKNNDSEDIYRLSDYESLEIQNEKITVMLFDHNEPISALDKFKKEIRKASSEYRLLPTEELAKESFEEASSEIIYDGSKNKLRSIKGFQDDRFGVSASLAKKIFLATQSNIKDKTKSSQQILNFFKDRRCLEYSSLWEKICTYFVLIKDSKALLKFELNIQTVLKKLTADNKIHSFEVAEKYRIKLKSAISLAISLRLEYFRTNAKFDSYIALSEQFRNAFLIRKTFVNSPLAELINTDNNQYLDLTTKTLAVDLELLKNYKYYPRYIHFHEILLAHYINEIDNGTIEDITCSDMYEKAQETFNSISNSTELTLDKILVTVENDIPTAFLQPDRYKNKLKIGLANFNIDSKIFNASYIRNPKIDLEREKELYKILNQSVDEGIDLLILPECSIPYDWLLGLVNFAHSKNIGIVFGLEHIISKKKAYNLLVTLLPVKLTKYSSLFIDIRVKKHYSPYEETLLKSFGYTIPRGKTHTLYQWNNVHFTTFNCFELADINDRAKFKSKIDLMIACEYNTDISYFSNLIESSARDLHCYFIQSNNAKYGDNRIYQPTSSIESDIVKIKGGENSTILVGSIDIEAFREFQIQLSDYTHTVTQKKKAFKPVPPDFDRNEVLKRIEASENAVKGVNID